MKKKTFSLDEIDTKVFEHFSHACARGDYGGAATLAQIILDHSKCDEIKKQVRTQFTLLTATRFSYLLNGDDELNKVHSKLHAVYLNRASKKLDISKDIPIFSEIACRYVDENISKLHFDRLYTLFQSLENVLTLPGDIIELGVYKGGSLKFTRELLDRFGGKQEVYGFDTFEGHAVITEHDGNVHREGMFKIGSELEKVVAYVNDPRVRLIKGDVSQTIGPFLAQSRGVALAHFDMDVYQPTADALPLVYEKLLPGGIILFDDYGFTSCPGVKRAVDDFLAITPALHFHLLTGQMILCKTAC